MNARRTTWALWGLFLLSMLYWVTRLWGHFPASMDTLEYVFPEKWFNVRSFQAGSIPLWNPYLACGIPHLANFQSAAFYPPFWIWNFTGLTDWFFVLSLAHGVLAAVGFTFWLRTQKVPSLIASLGGVTFGGSALLVYLWGFPTHLASLAWVPWVFAFAAKFLERPSTKWAGALGAVSALQILCGYPFFTFYAFLFLALWIFSRRAVPLRITLTLGGIGLLALGLTACQWLPFVDFLGYLKREGRGDFLFSLNWKNFWTLLQPQILGLPGTADYKGDTPNFIFNNLYLGLVPMGFFLWSFFSPKGKSSLFWRLSALFWICWIAGVHFEPLRLVPGNIMDVLEPSKASFLFVFCALTGVTIFLGERLQKLPKMVLVKGALWVMAALWVGDFLWVPGRVVQLVKDPYRDPGIISTVQDAIQWTGDRRILSLRRGNSIDQSVIALKPKTNVVMGFPSEEGPTNSMDQSVAALTPNTNVVWGLPSAGGYLSIYPEGHQNFVTYIQKGFPYGGRVLDAANVGLIVLDQALPDFKYSVHTRVGSKEFVKNAGAVGNAWVTEKTREFPDRASLWGGLLDPKAFLENEVYLQHSPLGGSVRLPPPSRFLQGEGTLAESPSPCRRRFEVDARQMGNTFVLDESFCPGWKAWVNGHPREIFLVDGLFMGVSLDPRTNQVWFSYEPTSFRLGLFLSLLSLVSGAGALLFFWEKRW